MNSTDFGITKNTERARLAKQKYDCVRSGENIADDNTEKIVLSGKGLLQVYSKVIIILTFHHIGVEQNIVP